MAKQLEEELAKFYEELAQRYAQGRDVFLAFARENRKNIVQIERAYYGVITDAIEGCYAFNMESDDYVLKTKLAKDAGYTGALNTALELEKMVIKFYNDAAEQSKSLMADVPRTFQLVARKRNERLAKLAALQGLG